MPFQAFSDFSKPSLGAEDPPMRRFFPIAAASEAQRLLLPRFAWPLLVNGKGHHESEPLLHPHGCQPQLCAADFKPVLSWKGSGRLGGLELS